MTNRGAAVTADGEGFRPIFEIRSETQGETAHLFLCGEFDLASEQDFRDRLAWVESKGLRKVVLDLTDVTFIDSTGLRMILALWERSREAGFELTMVKGPEAVHRVFEVTGLEKVLPIVDQGSSTS